MLTAGVSPGTEQAGKLLTQAGKQLTFSGTLVPAHTGQAVYLEREDASGIGFHVVDVGTVDAAFSYSIVDTFSDVATCVMRIRVPANSESQGSTSEPFTILVTPASAPLGSRRTCRPNLPRRPGVGVVTGDARAAPSAHGPPGC